MKYNRTRRFFLTASAISALTLAACGGTVRNAPPVLSEVAASVRASPETAAPRALALAGFDAWLNEGNADEARRLWDKALSGGSNDILALYGQSELARRSLDQKAREDALLKICESAPGHPLCGAVLHDLVSMLGESPARDAEIGRRCAALVEQRQSELSVDAAVGLRRIAARAAYLRGDAEARQRFVRDAGFIDQAWLLGPFSKYALLDWDTPFFPERGELEGEGLLGRVSLREQNFPDGGLDISGDPAGARIYYWTADLNFRTPGRYRLTGDGISARIFLDGSLVLERNTMEAFRESESSVELEIPAGRHRLLIKTPRMSGRRQNSVIFARVDGGPADFSISRPEGAGPQTQWTLLPLSTHAPRAEALAQAMRDEFGDGLSSFLAASTLMNIDQIGARHLAESLCQKSQNDSCSPALLVLRGVARMSDPSLSKAFAKGLVTQDLESALKADAAEGFSLLWLIAQARADRRLDRAHGLLAQLRRSQSSAAAAVAQLELGLARSDGLLAEAEKAALKLQEADPGNCLAARTLHDIARSKDAADKAEAALRDMRGCSGEPLARASFLKNRGDLKGARQAMEEVRRLKPSDITIAMALAELMQESGDAAGALAVVEELEKTWPHMALFPKKRAEILDKMGDAAGARAAREKALSLSGDDLKLRQALAITEGKEILPGALEDGLAWIERYRAAKPTEDAPATLVLDSYVTEIHPDGTSTSLTQTLYKAVNQEGAGQIAEVEIPPGAEILVLRTIKEDGRILEPEPIPGKDSVSMPGVETGDFVEVAFLTASAPPFKIAPGFTTPRFFFRSGSDRFFHTTMEIRVPQGMEVDQDLHDVPEAHVTRSVRDGLECTRIAFDDMGPLPAEPQAPSRLELVPWVRFGRNAGKVPEMLNLADKAPSYVVLSPAIQALADELTGEKTGRDAVEALWRGVMQRIEGGEQSSISAAATLSEGRGSRLNLLRALLKAKGIRTHLILVNGAKFDTIDEKVMPWDKWSTILLSAELPDGNDLLLFPAVRWAPFGKLPPAIAGARAARLPNAGEPAEVVLFQLPPVDDANADLVTTSLSLRLSEDGHLKGEGENVFRGFQASGLRIALDKMGRERMRQMIEKTLVASNFSGGRLLSFDVVRDDSGEGPVVFRYSFEAPGFARQDGGSLVIDKGIYTQNLAGSWLQVFSRETPLDIDAPMLSSLRVSLELPAGFSLDKQLDDVRLETMFGRFSRTEKIESGKVILSEDLKLNAMRVMPADYSGFGEMLTQIDRLEKSPWRLVRK